MTKPGRVAFAIASFVPAIGVIVAASLPQPAVHAAMHRGDLASLLDLPRHTRIVLGAVIGALVLVQVTLAAIVAMVVVPRKDLRESEKILWMVSVALVGSIAAPLFYFKKLRAPR